MEPINHDFAISLNDGDLVSDDGGVTFTVSPELYEQMTHKHKFVLKRRRGLKLFVARLRNVQFFYCYLRRNNSRWQSLKLAVRVAFS